LDSACEAHERTKSASCRILEPLGEIVSVLGHEQTPKALEQLISGGEAFIVLQHVA